MMLPRARRIPVLLYEHDHRAATAISTLLRAHGFAIATATDFNDVVTTVSAEPETVVVLSASTRGIGAVTKAAVRLRNRPEPVVHTAAVIAMVDAVADAAFGLRTEVDRVLIRPVPIERLVEAVIDVRVAQPSLRAKLRATA